MGIDKPNVRLVVHYTMSASREAYYREAGRASRDGGPGRCVLLYSAGDRQVHDFMIDQTHPPKDLIVKVIELLARQGALRYHDIVATAARGAAIAPRQAEAVIRILRRQQVLRDDDGGCLTLGGEVDWDDALARRRHEVGRLDAMDSYAATRECRRTFVLRYFGDPDAGAACAGCDNCHPRAPQAGTPTPAFLRRLLRL